MKLHTCALFWLSPALLLEFAKKEKKIPLKCSTVLRTDSVIISHTLQSFTQQEPPSKMFRMVETGFSYLDEK